jgi:hypothetical protein
MARARLEIVKARQATLLTYAPSPAAKRHGFERSREVMYPLRLCWRLPSETPASSAHLSHRATRYSMGAMPSTTPSRK